MKELNFKKWLIMQGVDVKLFWKNCKNKYREINIKKRKYIYKDNPKWWIDGAFSWDRSLDKSMIRGDWEELDDSWMYAIRKAEEKGIRIVYGFKKKREANACILNNRRNVRNVYW